ncbi:MAG: hypothetical protein KDC69_09265, partial [Flavobacteriaceae bacterium]|nr:hypothetical protein [Flavobacteriaceae bacterium]
IFLTFFGHGYIALTGNTAWVPYLEVLGFSEKQAIAILPIIGTVDILVALTILIRPFKWVVLWAAIWAFSTALIRPISGASILAFIERGANWMLPLIFYLIITNAFNTKIK